MLSGLADLTSNWSRATTDRIEPASGCQSKPKAISASLLLLVLHSNTIRIGRTYSRRETRCSCFPLRTNDPQRTRPCIPESSRHMSLRIAQRYMVLESSRPMGKRDQECTDGSPPPKPAYRILSTFRQGMQFPAACLLDTAGGASAVGSSHSRARQNCNSGAHLSLCGAGSKSRSAHVVSSRAGEWTKRHCGTQSSFIAVFAKGRSVF